MQLKQCLLLGLALFCAAVVATDMAHTTRSASWRRLDSFLRKSEKCGKTTYPKPESGKPDMGPEPDAYCVRGGGSSVASLLKGHNVEANNRGFYDPHNHFTGILGPWSLGLLTAATKYPATEKLNRNHPPPDSIAAGQDTNLKVKFTALVKDPAFNAAVAAAKQVIGDPNPWDAYLPDGDTDGHKNLLRVHSWLSTGLFAGIDLKKAANGNAQTVQFVPSRKNATPKEAAIGTKKTEFAALYTKLMAFRVELIKEMLWWVKHFYLEASMKTVKDEGLRATYGSWTHLALLRCAGETEWDANNVETIANLLEQSMSASGSVDFDTSYVIRNFFEDTVAKVGIGARLYARLVAQQLIDSNTRYVELSQPLFKVPMPAGSGDLFKPAAVEYHTVFVEDATLKSLIRVRWLPMYFQKRLAHIAGAGADAQFLWQGKAGDRAASVVNHHPGAGMWLAANADDAVTLALAKPWVTGVDFASPEVMIFRPAACKDKLITDEACRTAVFQQAGFKSFVKIAAILVSKCTNKKCVMHVHSGEGYPVYDYAAYFGGPTAAALHHADRVHDGSKRHEWLVDNSEGDRFMGFGTKTKFDKFCANAKKPFVQGSAESVIRVAAYSTSLRPIHYDAGEANVEGITLFLEAIKSAKSGDDENIIALKSALFPEGSTGPVLFRLGHGTHVTWNLAQRMRAVDLMIDNNFESNLATGALQWQDLRLTTPQRVPDLITLGGELLAASTAPEAPIHGAVLTWYHAAGFLNAYFAGVQIMPGSDGAGSEHSDIHDSYLIGSSLIINFIKQCIGDAPPVKGAEAVAKEDAFGRNQKELNGICKNWAKDKGSPFHPKNSLYRAEFLSDAPMWRYQRFYTRYMTGVDATLLKPWTV